MYSLPSSLYIHLPWCLSKCPYCDFNSYVISDRSQTERYVQALINDLKSEAKKFHQANLKTIFIGGGTPSLFSPKEIEKILKCVNHEFHIDNNCEITMELNPGSLEHHSLKDYKIAGINRLSIGAQSFNTKSLSLLGRLHTPEDTISVYKKAKQAKFKSINIDVMFGLPEQSIIMAKKDVSDVIKLMPHHISYFQLTIEPNTKFFYQRPKKLPSPDLSFKIQEECFSLLVNSNYLRYEISAFSLAGYECKHNLNYWRFGDYIAVGAGAHGKYRPTRNKIMRYNKPANPKIYMSKTKDQKENDMDLELSKSDKIFEFMLNNLRLESGFTEHDFESMTGIKFNVIEKKIIKLKEKGLINYYSDTLWKPSALGFRFLDDMQREFLED
tara:strand:- start:1012 stop:2163 length:1152 start_codon:yes stop_codon:yes gene_type:complete